jgi:hypothetical protein
MPASHILGARQYLYPLGCFRSKAVYAKLP